MIVVTGGIASGKSTFLEVARRMGYRVLDADDWYKSQFSFMAEQYAQAMFNIPASKLGTVAFKHKLWPIFMRLVDLEFLNDVRELRMDGATFDMIVVPDYFQRSIAFDVPVITIERADNLKAALVRDTSRDSELTKRIHKWQMPAEERIKRADDVLYNVTATKEEFEKDCEIWLKSRLQGLLTHHTKVMHS